MRLVLKGVATQVSLETGAEFHSLDFIDEDGDPSALVSIPVGRETVQFLMEQLRGEQEDHQGEPPAEPEEPDEEPPPPPPPAVRPPVSPRTAATFQSARKRMQQPGSDEVPPL